jgi:hypothetical protein
LLSSRISSHGRRIDQPGSAPSSPVRVPEKEVTLGKDIQELKEQGVQKKVDLRLLDASL